MGVFGIVPGYLGTPLRRMSRTCPPKHIAARETKRLPDSSYSDTRLDAG